MQTANFNDKEAETEPCGLLLTPEKDARLLCKLAHANDNETAFAHLACHNNNMIALLHGALLKETHPGKNAALKIMAIRELRRTRLSAADDTEKEKSRALHQIKRRALRERNNET